MAATRTPSNARGIPSTDERALHVCAAGRIFLLPYLPKEFQEKLKLIFFVYHFAWAATITYVALLPASTFPVYISVAVMYGFTIAGGLAPTS